MNRDGGKVHRSVWGGAVCCGSYTDVAILLLVLNVMQTLQWDGLIQKA